MVRRRAHYPKVVGSKPELATLRKASLGKVLTQIVPLSTQEQKWVPGS